MTCHRFVSNATCRVVLSAKGSYKQHHNFCVPQILHSEQRDFSRCPESKRLIQAASQLLRTSNTSLRATRQVALETKAVTSHRHSKSFAQSNATSRVGNVAERGRTHLKNRRLHEYGKKERFIAENGAGIKYIFGKLKFDRGSESPIQLMNKPNGRCLTYDYDKGGKRLNKISLRVAKNIGVEAPDYYPKLYLPETQGKTSPISLMNFLHYEDNHLAVLDVKTSHNQLIRYQFTKDHYYQLEGIAKLF